MPSAVAISGSPTTARADDTTSVLVLHRQPQAKGFPTFRASYFRISGTVLVPAAGTVQYSSALVYCTVLYCTETEL